MCLHPHSIRNPTKSINIDGGQLLRMLVPCGTCAQCLQAKRNEWYIRTHYEIKRTISHGGYIYFDTLTYNNENLPMLSHFVDTEKYGLDDFSCFNREHFKAFVKRLRRKISYHYGIKKDCFRYFVTTEYGEDNRFTHRPHYHVLFFVYGPILPIKFSQFVADCWSYGRTDGYPYKPSCYVAEHTYQRGVDHKTTESVAMYVSKYITKNSNFMATIRGRLASLREKLTYYDTLNNSHILHYHEELLKALKRSIEPFHCQSQGFGLGYLDNLTPEKLMYANEDKVILQDSHKVVKTYPMPMYYRRKLHYTLEKHADGTRYWQLTDNGVSHVIAAKLAKVNSITLKYMDIIRNCSNSNLVDDFFKYLCDRDISDYVIYEQFYKGRHRLNTGINYKNNTQKPLQDEEDNLYDWLNVMRVGLRPYHNAATSLPVDATSLRTPILTKAEQRQHNDELYKHGHFPELCGNSRSVLLNDYIQSSVFNENTDVKFAHFDKIAVLLELMTEEKREDEQITFDYLEDLKARYKCIFNKTL